MPIDQLPGVTLSSSAMAVLEAAPKVHFVSSVAEIAALAVPEGKTDGRGFFEVGYDVDGRWKPEVHVCRVKNGVAANYLEPYMRRRDPDCMVIADDRATDKATWDARWGGQLGPFEDTRQDTFAWLGGQELICQFFSTGLPGQALEAVAICPRNAAFFAAGLAMLQGIKPIAEVVDAGADYHHGAIVYVAPPFRHTKFGGKQVVVHNRRFDDGFDLHELYSYNLYPGPSAKKGVYGMLLTAGERDQESWTTAHCSTVQVVTPYDNVTTIMHEGASGGGKSEMLEQMHREADGRLRKGRNLVSGETRYMTLPRGCELRPVTDDMALCHPSLQDGAPGAPKKLTVIDAETSWFLRVNHIESYGTDPHLEALTVHPRTPLVFLNIEAHPGATALIWEPVIDEPATETTPAVPCPNPRVVLPRADYPGIVDEPVTVDIRSFGVRCPPCTAEHPTYGIMGLFHVLPPSLAWLWRLVAPRGHGNPSIVDRGGMTSEGVGSYWPFATGRRVDQANILLDQILETPDTLFVLIPNQHIGCWEVGFAPQWVSREYLARRGSAAFRPGDLVEARCPLLGLHKETIQVEGQVVGTWFTDVSKQKEVGTEGYDRGADILKAFFKEQLAHFDHPELDPRGKKIIDACLSGCDVDAYRALS